MRDQQTNSRLVVVIMLMQWYGTDDMIKLCCIIIIVFYIFYTHTNIRHTSRAYVVVYNKCISEKHDIVMTFFTSRT